MTKKERVAHTAKRFALAAANATAEIPADMFGMKVTHHPEKNNVPYTLTGPRGGIRKLVRNVGNPRLMYVIDKHGQISHVKGNYTFADDAPKGLRPVYSCDLYR